MEDNGPIGHMGNEKALIDDKAPELKRVNDPHATTNLLLGNIVGQLTNLAITCKINLEKSNRHHDEWQEAIAEISKIQAKAQKVGAIILIGGVTLLSTFISVVISLLI